MADLPATLAGMLDAIERRAPQSRIELGLDRVRSVHRRLGLALDGTRVISVAGTNGKGSTVAFLEAVAAAAGIRHAAYTSPHIVRFGERIRIDGAAAPDDEIAEALVRVERARADVPLTWFEHVTLAAFCVAAARRPQWLIAEVGMGGRLDAVNVLDADVAVITSIGLDHQRWLGRTRAAIAREKCGIARRDRPVIVGEKNRPGGMLDRLEQLGARPLLAGRDFNWRWRGECVRIDLGRVRLGPLQPGLAGRHQAGNAACAALAALEAAPGLDAGEVAAGLAAARLPGRFEYLAGNPDVVIDVAHNPAAARVLGAQLLRLPGRKLAVFAALADKDVAGIVRALSGRIDRWFAATLQAPRAVPAATLRRRMVAAGARPAPEALESVADALAAARRAARPGDTVVVFGSFLTAAAAVEALQSEQPDPPSE
jgi:dihydrofolate synthase/folylpolyglutamate synthase